MSISAIALNCTLKASGEESSTDRLIAEVAGELRARGVETEVVRVVDLNIKPGVTSDEGDGDEWPGLRARILDADILVLGGPIWLGQPSSVCKRVLERLDAFLGETDADGQMPSGGHVAIVVTVGNEDGAHHCAAEIYQALSDVGFTIPANAQAYWVGEAMGSVDFVDLDKVPDNVTAAAKAAARNAHHLASLLTASPYPVAK